MIPDSGPSGRIGFRDRAAVIHWGERDFAHGDYFEPTHLRRNFERLWGPFFTRPGAGLGRLADGTTATPWRQSNWLLRANVVRLMLLAMALAIVCFAAMLLALGALRALGH